MIYFDLDGVLRNLALGVFGKEEVEWNELTAEGKGLVQHVNENLEMLCDCEVLPYENVFKLVYHIAPVKILTAQHLAWQPYTLHWIYNYLPYVNLDDVLTVDHPRDKLPFLGSNDVLIDDNPYYRNNEKVITIHRHYNRKTKAHCRVSNNSELLRELSERWDTIV